MSPPHHQPVSNVVSINPRLIARAMRDDEMLEALEPHDPNCSICARYDEDPEPTEAVGWSLIGFAALCGFVVGLLVTLVPAVLIAWML